MVTKMFKKKSSGTRFIKISMSQGINRKLTEEEKKKIRNVVQSFSKLNKVEQKQAIKSFRIKYPKKKRRSR